MFPPTICPNPLSSILHTKANKYISMLMEDEDAPPVRCSSQLQLQLQLQSGILCFICPQLFPFSFPSFYETLIPHSISVSPLRLFLYIIQFNLVFSLLTSLSFFSYTLIFLPSLYFLTLLFITFNIFFLHYPMAKP